MVYSYLLSIISQDHSMEILTGIKPKYLIVSGIYEMDSSTPFEKSLLESRCRNTTSLTLFKTVVK